MNFLTFPWLIAPLSTSTILEIIACVLISTKGYGNKYVIGAVGVATLLTGIGWMLLVLSYRICAFQERAQTGVDIKVEQH
jgi:hypothetical protein